MTGNPPPLSYEFATVGDNTTYDAWVFARDVARTL